MEQEKKKLNLKIIIPIIVVIVVLTVVAIINYNKKENERLEAYRKENILTTEEEFAVDYLLMFANNFKQPHSIKLFKVWAYHYKRENETEEHWYFAYNLSANNAYGGAIESTYGNEKELTNTDFWLTVMRGESLNASDYWCEENSNYLPAKEFGTLLNADKIQKAFEKKL